MVDLYNSFPNCTQIVSNWNGFESGKVADNEFKYYGLDNPTKWTKLICKKISELPVYKDMTYKFNELGYRSDPFIKSDKKNFLFIGCSFSFGQGLPLDYLYTKKVADHFDAEHWNLSIPGNNIESILLSLKSFYNSGYKADKVILQLPYWERQVYVGEDEFIHWTPQNIASAKNNMHNHWLLSTNENMYKWNWWLVANAIKGVLLENNADYVNIIIKSKYKEVFNDGFDMDQVWRQVPKDTPKIDLWARDGVHPGKVPHDMFAKALIDHLEGKKPADPVLDILKNPQF